MIIVISNPTPVANEAATINRLFDEGLEIFHVRKKDFSEREMREYIENISEKYFSKLVLHSHYHLAQEYHLKGIHVSANNKNMVFNKPVSVSFHSLNEIKEFSIDFSYGFLSSIFNSISKTGYKSAFDLNELKSFLKDREEKVIALGGIDENNIDQLKDINFAGIALLGAIWNNENPIEKFISIKKKWEKRELAY